MELVQVVPALPPAFSGVGDFAVLLARELLARHGVGTRFVVGDPGWKAAAAHDAEFPAVAVAARSSGALRAVLEETPGVVLLHYVNYGYAARGCPFWLVDALERWKRHGPPRRLIVLFHEVYASGPPWKSVFWAGLFQQWIAVRLARLADARRITTTISLQEMRRMLRGAAADLPATVAPVFSTLGEPAGLPPLSTRERQVVVFGSRPMREEVYARAAGLENFCARHGITRVVDVGAPVAGGIRLGGGIEVRAAGALPAAQASALFARSLAGYFNYPAPHLGKSTIFAAYCAHGMLPVTFPGNDGAREGLCAGEHYLAAGDGGDGDGGSFERVADAAHAWYRGHRLAVHAHDICSLM